VLIAVALMAATVHPPSGQSKDLRIASRSNAYPSMAAEGRFVAIAWGATTQQGVIDIYVAVSRDGGGTFGTPARVSDAQTRASLSGEQPPQVSLIPRAEHEPSIVVVWTSKTAAGTRLVSAQSDDGGRSFARVRVMPGSDAPGNRGWQATATDSRGSIVAVWLDHRELASPAAGPTAAHEHGAHPPESQMDGTARAQLSKLYFARLDSLEGGRALTGGVCYCCKTTIATGADGPVYVAWRHVYPGNVRDIAFTMSRDGGRTFSAPVRVSADNWVLDGCPENGPSMAVDANGRIHLIWPTLVRGAAPASEPTLALFYATSRDGRQFTPRQRIPTEGVPRHAQIAVDVRGGVIAVWEEQAEGTRRVAVGRGMPDTAGDIRLSRQIVSDRTPAVYPTVVTTADGAVVAWTSGPAGQTVLRTAVLPQ
jgi:hypothetical protein